MKKPANAIIMKWLNLYKIIKRLLINYQKINNNIYIQSIYSNLYKIFIVTYIKI